jgi:ABC-type sulfate/molybdate transport systems ATPase subunit
LSLTAAEDDITLVEAEAAAATAVARTVAGLVPPVSGRIFVGRRDVTGLPAGGRQIGYVPRGGALFPHLTVRQNIEYLVWRQESVHEILRGWSSTLIYQLELGPVLDQRPHEITAQQRMRAAVARAVVTLPEVLVFERPDLTVCGPLEETVARIESPASPPPATVVFGDPVASPGSALIVAVTSRSAP